MNNTGLGIDIIEISRIRSALESYGKRFLDKIFTPGEQTYCMTYKDPAPHLAGRFAAKEAVVKALGIGFRQGISWRDIAIARDTLGRPSVQLSALLQQRFPNVELLLSISHCRAYAAAVASVKFGGVEVKR